MIAIRAAEPRDAEAIAAIYAPHVRDGVVSFETEAPDASVIGQRMAASDGLYPWLAATGEGEDTLLGYAYASRFRDREAYRFVVETTIYMAPDAQGKGAGRALYATLLATLRAQGFTQAIGAIALPNAASVQLHERLGFARAGLLPEVGYKFGRWVDVGYWQVPLAAAAVPPDEPRKFSMIGIVRG